MTTKRDVTGNKGEQASVRRNQMGEEREDQEAPRTRTRERHQKPVRDEDPDAGIHDA